MIDIMSLRESYERRELFEIRWIHGHDNPADAMTKSNANAALNNFINDNQIELRVQGWTKRDGHEIGADHSTGWKTASSMDGRDQQPIQKTASV
ncbi:hypothetical protein M011DRAFT_499945 [Sporormia fimetaria CBS 119925]|uniref:Uncharacterized protein n=1 Tax=Sporormia fimetaria CBS 119925 TaxID=1340428 RepID=A0A6A6UX78_9PLEO|nr:hypothetical protein M011DRAFT_499945 [Sporormia fimetaria CBS 119925]